MARPVRQWFPNSAQGALKIPRSLGHPSSVKSECLGAEARHQHLKKKNAWVVLLCLCQGKFASENTKGCSGIEATGLEKGQLYLICLSGRERSRGKMLTCGCKFHLPRVFDCVTASFSFSFLPLLLLSLPSWSFPLAAAPLTAWFLLVTVKSKNARCGICMLLGAPPMLPVRFLEVCSCFCSGQLRAWHAGEGRKGEPNCRVTSHLTNRDTWRSRRAVGCLLRWGLLPELADWPQNWILCSLSKAQSARCFASWGNGGLSSWSTRWAQLTKGWVCAERTGQDHLGLISLGWQFPFQWKAENESSKLQRKPDEGEVQSEKGN